MSPCYETGRSTGTHSTTLAHPHGAPAGPRLENINMTIIH